MKVRNILEELQVIPTKKRGQNFLLNNETAKAIVDFANLESNAPVVEIGPGLGALTAEILKITKRFSIIEIESKFCEFLKSQFPELVLINNISFLDANLEKIAKDLNTDSFTLISNVPYSISSDLFLWLINNRQFIDNASLLFQREFTERLAANPGTKEYGSLSVMCNLFTNHKLGKIISGASFYPSAEVESRLIKIEILKNPKYKINDLKLYENIVRAAFSHRRKTIYNSLKSSNLNYDSVKIKSALEHSGFNPNARAETFSAEDYARLSNNF